MADMLEPTDEPQVIRLDVTPSPAQDRALVRRWQERLRQAREFDKAARRGYALDRTYCEAVQTGFSVSVPIAGTYTDLLTAFLYARDPAVLARPAESVGDKGVKAATEFGKTTELVVSALWQRARLRRSAKVAVRSALSVGVGWLKVVWHEQAGRDPVTEREIRSLQDQLARLADAVEDVAEGEATDPEAERAAILAQLDGLQAKQEPVRARGLVVDYVAPEDIQVSPDCHSLADYLDAPWIAHRVFMSHEQATALYGCADDALASATRYMQRAPVDRAAMQESGLVAGLTETDADRYVTGAGDAGSTDGANTAIAVWEIWSAEDNQVYTMVEGVADWLRPPFSPQVNLSQFYPFFGYMPLEVDGRRHPESLVSRSRHLLDEYNRIRTNYRNHRARAVPMRWHNERVMTPETAQKIAQGATIESIGINPVGDSATLPLGILPYPPVDQALYDTSAIRAELEMVWGIQEALSSSIHTAKTLGEAEIQQSGTEARMAFKRDALDWVLGEIARATAEIAMQVLDVADVREIAGPEALWPRTNGGPLTPDDLHSLLAIDIEAGTSGRPDTTAKQQVWMQILPIMKDAITNIAELRRSSPNDVADAIEALVQETFDRFGERVDVSAWLPKQGEPQPPMPAAMPGAPPALAAVPDLPAVPAGPTPALPTRGVMP